MMTIKPSITNPSPAHAIIENPITPAVTIPTKMPIIVKPKVQYSTPSNPNELLIKYEICMKMNAKIKNAIRTKGTSNRNNYIIIAMITIINAITPKMPTTNLNLPPKLSLVVETREEVALLNFF